MHNSNNNCNCIEGICCKVKNCTYNCDSSCFAPSVEVGPHFASCSNETICGTFKPKN